MRRLLLTALLTPAIAYFILIAIRPDWLALPWMAHSALPWSIVLALAVIWYGFAITLLYALLTKRR